MGVTYKAIDTVLNRPVALKVVTKELLNSSEAKHRFLREAQAAALIHHPNVATIFQFGEEVDACFYAMEFVEGEDLERYVSKRGPLSAAASLSVVSQVAGALEAAQARNLIHRDIKPANIMAVANRHGKLQIKLIDFGLAKACADDSAASLLTRTQDFIGSPAFASPEQCETKELDIRSDIYSLGATLWYLLSGRPPFVGKLAQVMVAQVTKPPPFEKLANVPEPVISLLRRMLEKVPEDRFQTPEELEAAIGQAGNELFRLEAVPAPIRFHASLRGEPKAELDPSIDFGDTSGPDTHAASTASESSQVTDSSKLKVGALLGNRYRLLVEGRGGIAGRLFIARDELGGSNQGGQLGIKLLHPSIVRDPQKLDLVESALRALNGAPHPNLLQYLSLGQGPPYLVREWIYGFLLYELLRWRRSLKAVEAFFVLDPLASTLDFLADKEVGPVEVSVRKIFLQCPIRIQDFVSLARGNPQDWSPCTIKLNPLSLGPLVSQGSNDLYQQTIVPLDRALCMYRGGTETWKMQAVRSFARLTYELLSGRPPAGAGEQLPQFVPIPELTASGNDILRRALLLDDSHLRFANCRDLRDALRSHVTSDARLLAVSGRSAEPPAAAPFPNPAIFQPAEPKRNLFLLLSAVLTLALIIGGLMIFGAIQFSARLNPPPSQPSFHAQSTANGSPALAAGAPTIVADAPTLRQPASTPTLTPRNVAPASMVPSSPTPNEEDESKRLILHLIEAIETHDDPLFLKYVDRDIDYFGHKHASKAFIQRDMEQDAKTYQSVQMVPDLSTLEASADQAFVEYDLNALEVSGKDHKARCRLEIDFAPGPTPRLLSISSRVLSR
ncbi:MAG: protein kinase [Verrucomicrobia bacterium]|nr:protein kinase [Verrucomicrobiota bacterium]